MTSPTAPYAWAAASRSIPAASCTLNMPQPKVPPVSAVISPAISSARSSSSEAAALSSDRRPPGAPADQAGNAAAAASTARRTSSRPAAATDDDGSPSTGPELSQRRPDPASTHSPPINSRCGSWTCTVAIRLLLLREHVRLFDPD